MRKITQNLKPRQPKHAACHRQDASDLQLQVENRNTVLAVHLPCRSAPAARLLPTETKVASASKGSKEGAANVAHLQLVQSVDQQQQGQVA